MPQIFSKESAGTDDAALASETVVDCQSGTGALDEGTVTRSWVDFQPFEVEAIYVLLVYGYFFLFCLFCWLGIQIVLKLCCLPLFNVD